MDTLWMVLASIGGLYVLLCLIMLLFQHRIIFRPSPLPEDHVFKPNVKAEMLEVFTEAEDGGKAHGLFFEKRNAKGAVLFFHGNGRNLDDWMEMVPHFFHRGYSVLLVEYRQYGKSTGKLTEKGLKEDARLMYLQLKNIFHVPEEKIVVYGTSMGTHFATAVAASFSPKWLILEAPYKSVRKLAFQRAPFLPIPLLLRFPLRTDKLISKVKCHISIIHGTEDKVIPHSHSRELMQSITHDHKGLLEVEGVGHNDLREHPEYQRFLDLVLGRKK